MFVALIPPADVVEDLAAFVAPRQEADTVAGALRWTSEEQWHVTLAFLPGVADRHLDDLCARLERAAARRTGLELAVRGGGAFPNPARARVLYAGVEARDPDELSRLATGVRAAATKSGAGADGGRFHPHLTLARLRRPTEVTRWIRVFDAYTGPWWHAREVALVASHLGEGPRNRPRYELVGTFALGRR
ncbi:MAG TPA: RNA 2',3'-cyclic phosphodiesterase [Nocardioidaceae bacterium]|nr:RNA 2',3'-cyclic phosphodiesterase [Nocardioidaceae bacterium]